MSHSSELNSYIAQLRKRLRAGAWLRGAAIFTGSALAVTIALVLVLNQLAFPAQGVTVARLLMIVALAVVAILGLALPVLHLTSARAVRHAEVANPDLEQRLTTFQESETKEASPILELLAADTLPLAQQTEPALLVPDNRLFALGGAALGCVAVLFWLIAAGPGFLGYGASLIWTGPKQNAVPLYTIAVNPGNITVRRNSDQLIVARVAGMKPDKAQLFAHYQSAAGWERVAMQAAPDAGSGATYQFVLAGLPENVEYYVAAGPLVSPHYKVHVVDLPSVKEIRVTYHYPAWTAMKPVTEEHSGDLRAIEGTDAQIEVEMDRPLQDGQLTLDDGQTIHFAGGASNKYQGTIHMEKDGAYHVAATDEGQPVRLSEDYFIATDKANPPQIAIERPAGDYRASPIEEVTVGVKAADDFGVRDMHLHYSVNGGQDHDLSLLKTPGSKTADGSYMLPLEDFKLVPGDVISVYATARDGHSDARTDISFIQVDPFEREFSQSQQSGGGGGGAGGGNDQTEISKREKELIAATWKQQNDKKATPKDAAAQGQFLSDAQQKLRDQVNALNVRMQSRDISQANEEFTDFDKDMQSAAAVMGPSADKLKATQWKDALPLEQKALQALLRAEATFRQIEVAFGQRGGGGGGGANSGRDLASLFDLELDTEKNQYETAQSASPAEQREKDVEDALEKLDALAKRQQDLANQPHDPQQSFEERWQQEMLRREAEQLQRQMEQLARNGQQGQQGGQDQEGQQESSDSNASSSGQSNTQQSSSSQSGDQGESGSQSSRQQTRGQSSGSSSGQSADQRVQQALSRLQQATDIMKRGDSAQQNAESTHEAADRLRDAANLLAGTQQQLTSGKLNSLSREAGRLQQEEREQADRIDKLAAQREDSGSSGSSSADSGMPDLQSAMARLRERDQLAAERQQLSDDLAGLQKNLRDAAREMAPNQPVTAQKLHDALTEMDDSDLGNHVQRTADWLRSGINPNSNGTENEIAQGLAKLNQQLQQAQSAKNTERPGQQGSAQSDESEALNQIERLRSQLEASGQSRNGNNGPQGNGNQGNQHDGRPTGNGGGANRNGQQPGSGPENGQQRDWASDQQPPSRSGQRGGNGSAFGPNPGVRNDGGASGDNRYGGGGANGTVWGNFDTGNNTPRARGQNQPAPTDASGNPSDTERAFEQHMRELNQLRQMVGDDPEAAKEVADLTRQMQRLDPNRFPGNPQIVEQMHKEILNSVDKLELQLQRDGASTDARTGKPDAVPAGYQDSVAEYYRRLSKNP